MAAAARRAVFGDQVGGRHAELIEHLLLELLDPQCRLGFGDLVAVQRLGERGDLRAELGDLLAHLGQRLDPLVAFGGQRVTTAGRDPDRRVQPLRKAATRFGDRRRDGGGVFAGLPRALRPQPGLPLGCRGAPQ